MRADVPTVSSDHASPGCAKACRGLKRGLALACLVTLSVTFAGCAAIGRQSPKELNLREILLEDQAFQVDRIPGDASPGQATSLRIASQGVRSLEAGRLEEAEDKLERALLLDPANPFCYFYLARVRGEEGDFGQALTLLSQAEVHFQEHPYWLSEVAATKGVNWERLGSPDKARASFCEAVRYNPWNDMAKDRCP